MHIEAQQRLESLGLGVAKLTVMADDQAKLGVTYYGDTCDSKGPALHHLELFAAEAPIRFPGRYTMKATGSLSDSAVILELERSEGCGFFRIAVYRSGEIIARGMGLKDPDDSASMLVSWWTGAVEPYGVVKYTIRDDQAIAGCYISIMSPDQPGHDLAIGDTSGGFTGTYTLNSLEESGRTWGPHEWRLAQRDDIVDLTWTEHGRIFCRGLGIVDPDNPRSFIATYLAV